MEVGGGSRSFDFGVEGKFITSCVFFALYIFITSRISFAFYFKKAVCGSRGMLGGVTGQILPGHPRRIEVTHAIRRKRVVFSHLSRGWSSSKRVVFILNPVHKLLSNVANRDEKADFTHKGLKSLKKNTSS